MLQNEDNFKRGTAELLILHLLQKEDLYGYQITKELAKKSDGDYTILEGSLYSILFRMADAGYISHRIEKVGVKRTRRYYHLEEPGKLYYLQLLNDYDKITKSICKILERDTMAQEYDRLAK